MLRANYSVDQIEKLAGMVGSYIAEQRTTFLGHARPIESAHRRVIEPFFPVDILDGARIAHGKVPEPSFYPLLRLMGITNAPAFSQMAGITFQDVIVHTEPLTDSLLFHELVHAVQYKHLGLQGFANRYVGGFLHGGSYEEIPLEKQAYELEGRFVSAPQMPFSVEDDVKEKIRLNQY